MSSFDIVKELENIISEVKEEILSKEEIIDNYNDKDEK